MHHCRIIGIRRWKGSFDDVRGVQIAIERASENKIDNVKFIFFCFLFRVGTGDDGMNAVKIFTDIIKFPAEKCTIMIRLSNPWDILIVEQYMGTYRRANF